MLRDFAKGPPRKIALFSRFLNLFKLYRRLKEALREDVIDYMNECREVLICDPFLCLLSLIFNISIRCQGIPGINQERIFEVCRLLFVDIVETLENHHELQVVDSI